MPFLADLGVMTAEGKIVRSRYDKFRQINRFLEFIEDVLPRLDKSRENVIIDFGCGKSYLTFAMYYYLKVRMGYPIRIIGLDLKQDVIDHCNQLSRKYGYDTLNFYHGDIAGSRRRQSGRYGGNPSCLRYGYGLCPGKGCPLGSKGNFVCSLLPA